MRHHIRRKVASELDPIFDERSRNEVISWLVASQGRRVVVVVGAGFSKNAVWRDSRRTGQPHLPDWKSVDTALAMDLGISPSAYDGLLLADLHCADLGEPRFYHTLLSMVSDSEIAPGVAHQALFSLSRPEAIVTTNQLDTLLDRPHSNRIVPWKVIADDADLAQPSSEVSVQVIYIHGHRDRPDGWVFRHSDYQDIESRRPVMMRRVRQLLAQYPVLFVGFSLTDPNFHSLARQTNREMLGCQPQALAIMVQQPPLAFARYWERLGIRVGVMKDAAAAPNSFATLFRLIEIMGRDSRPESSLITAEDVRQELTLHNGIKARLQVIREVTAGQMEPGGRLREKSRDDHRRLFWDLWFESAMPDHPGERERVRTGPRYATRSELGERHFSRLDQETRDKITAESSNISLRNLDESRFSFRLRVDRAVDWNLSHGVPLQEIAEWLLFGLSEFVDVISPDESQVRELVAIANACSWAWTELGKAQNTSEQLRHRAHSVASACFRLLKRYFADDQLLHVATDLGHFNDREEAFDDIPRSVTETLKAATALALDGDIESAKSKYANAREIAYGAQLVWHEWIATLGLSGCHRALGRVHAEPESTNQWDDRALDLEREQPVASWIASELDATQRRMLSALARFRRDREERHATSRTITFSGPGLLWRKFRELEDAGASPWQLFPMAKALIDTDIFLDDEAEEMRFRAKYAVPDSGKWLRRIAMERVADRSAARSRDQSLTESLLRPTGTHSHTLIQLECISEVRWFADCSDVPTIATTLLTIRDKIGTDYHIFNRSGECGTHLARAWMTYADLATRGEDLAPFLAYAKGEDLSRHEVDGLIRCLAYANLSFATSLSRPDTFVSTALELAARSTPQRGLENLVAAEALLDVAGGSRTNNRIKFDDGIETLVKSRLLLEVDDYLAAQRAYLLMTLYPSSDHLALLTSKKFADVDDGINVLASCVSGCCRSADASMIDAAYREMKSALSDGRDSWLKYVRLNPANGSGSKVVQAICDACIASGDPLSEYDKQLVLEVIALEPDSVEWLDRILAPRWWGTHWSPLVHTLEKFARSDDTTRLSALGLLLARVQYDNESNLTWAIPLLATVLCRVSDERALVAARATLLASRLEMCTRQGQLSSLRTLVMDGLTDATDDSRALVRSAAVAASSALSEHLRGSGRTCGLDQSALVARALAVQDALSTPRAQ
jgi:SIR2-like domain